MTLRNNTRTGAAAIMAACLCVLSVPAMAADGLRPVAAENLLVIDTNRGRILIEMAPQIAPLHVERIRRLAGEGFYDNVVWHRVIDGFMAQSGDPTGTGDGGSTYRDLPGELLFRRGADSGFVSVAQPMGMDVGFIGSVPIVSQSSSYLGRLTDGKVSAWGTYCPGVAGMARDEAENSANSQFFFMRDAYPSLDKRYTVWGRVVDGLELVRSLKAGALPSGAVESPDVMLTVRAADQIDPASRPYVRISDPSDDAFAQTVAQTRALRGADFSICDVPLVVQVTSAGQ